MTFGLPALILQNTLHEKVTNYITKPLLSQTEHDYDKQYY